MTLECREMIIGEEEEKVMQCKSVFIFWTFLNYLIFILLNVEEFYLFGPKLI